MDALQENVSKTIHSLQVSPHSDTPLFLLFVRVLMHLHRRTYLIYVSSSTHFPQDAGIKVWMLTGDKLSTAMQIAVSAGMARDLAAFHMIDSTSPDALEQQLRTLSRCARGAQVEDEGVSPPSFTGKRSLRSAGGAAAAIVVAGESQRNCSRDMMQLLCNCSVH
jgi:hypothetical protein